MYTSFIFTQCSNQRNKTTKWTDKHIELHKHSSKKRNNVYFVVVVVAFFYGGKWIFGRVNFCSCQQHNSHSKHAWLWLWFTCFLLIMYSNHFFSSYDSIFVRSVFVFVVVAFFFFVHSFLHLGWSAIRNAYYKWYFVYVFPLFFYFYFFGLDVFQFLCI